MNDEHRKKYENFCQLHKADAAFVIPNAWDGGSARILTHLGFSALATTSAGFAFSLGVRDSSHALGREAVLENASAIAQATHLPVSGDLEEGFGKDPETCAETIRLAAATGLVGGSIEDATGDPDNAIYGLGLAVDRIAASAEAARDKGFLLTARAENYLWVKADLKDTIRRLQSYSEAGADVLYAPGLPDLDAIRTVCAAVDRPVNVVMGLSGPASSVEELQQAGVRRISVGGSFARAAIGAMIRAAEEVRDKGTFNYACDAVPDRVVAQMMSDQKRP